MLQSLRISFVFLEHACPINEAYFLATIAAAGSKYYAWRLPALLPINTTPKQGRLNTTHVPPLVIATNCLIAYTDYYGWTHSNRVSVAAWSGCLDY